MLGMSLAELFMNSPTMVVLLICSVITVGFAVERALYFIKTRGNAPKFLKDLKKQLQGNDLKSALKWCQEQKGAAPRVVSQCLPQLHINVSELKQRFNTAIEMEQVEMERNLSVLGTMSNIAPLLGLFGTVIGIIRAFADIARTGAGGSAVVAMGVSEALLTTAAGIVVAVIATICFNLYVRRIRTRVIELEDVREEFFNIVRVMTANRQSAAAAKTSTQSAETIYEAASEVTQEPVTAGK
jgi:biopolymer transport protein ExbB/TolQ